MKYIAYAKINIRLNVLGKKESGYHDLSMVNAKISLADEIEFKEALVNKVEYSLNELNHLDNDLCFNVLNEMISKYQIKKHYYIYIKKNIPLGAGLGGGSADVACIINAIDQLHNLQLSLEEKIEIGIKYGADVPYCLINDVALVEGIGEKITNLNVGFKKKIIAVYPNIVVSTKQVFQKVKAYSDSVKKEDLIKYIYNEEYDKLLINDLEKPSFEINSELKIIKNSLLKFGPVVMSGSGSTMLVFANEENAFNQIKKLYPEYLIVDTYII